MAAAAVAAIIADILSPGRAGFPGPAASECRLQTQKFVTLPVTLKRRCSRGQMFDLLFLTVIQKSFRSMR